jgi:hypothetical protein
VRTQAAGGVVGPAVPPFRTCGDPGGVHDDGEAQTPPEHASGSKQSASVVHVAAPLVPASAVEVLAAPEDPPPLEQAARTRVEIVAANVALDIARLLRRCAIVWTARKQAAPLWCAGVVPAAVQSDDRDARVS